jgi:hypothetical protein
MIPKTRPEYPDHDWSKPESCDFKDAVAERQKFDRYEEECRICNKSRTNAVFGAIMGLAGQGKTGGAK